MAYTAEPSKTPTNSHVKSQTPEKPHLKTHKQPKINRLQAKNKSVKNGILVSLSSIN
jgi:hypothetical protein